MNQPLFQLLPVSIILACLLLTNCNSDLPEEHFSIEEVTYDFFFQGMIVDNDEQTPIAYKVGEIVNPVDETRVFLWHHLEWGFGPYFRAGVAIYSLPFEQTGRSEFDFTFSPDNVGADRIWSQDEVQDYFFAGKRFAMGDPTTDAFSFNILLPGFYQENHTSRSSFLADPEGELIVIAVEEYEYEDHASGVINTRRGLRVIAEFNAEVGRYDRERIQQEGTIGFQTNDIVRLENGEASFFVPYDEEI